METPALETRNLGRVYPSAEGAKTLLRDISFHLNRGQILAVVGPSGAGKTTLLRLLNRLDEPTAGEVLLHGRDYRLFPLTQLRQKVGMVMQFPYLFPGNVTHNVSYGPNQRGISLLHAEIDELLRLVDMSGTAEQDVSTLSGGEAQRISIARSLANEPEILLLDEPTSALDPDAKRAIERLLINLVRMRHVTCVWVTHDLEQARRVADMVLRIEAGKMTAFTTSGEFFHA